MNNEKSDDNEFNDDTTDDENKLFLITNVRNSLLVFTLKKTIKILFIKIIIKILLKNVLTAIKNINKILSLTPNITIANIIILYD